jgi:hypothetical protein
VGAERKAGERVGSPAHRRGPQWISLLAGLRCGADRPILRWVICTLGNETGETGANLWVTGASKREPTTQRIVQIPLMECRLLEHKSLRQRFIHAGLLKAREYAWPQVAQRIMNY